MPRPLLLALLAIAAFGGYLRFVAMTETVVDRPLRADAGEYYLSAYNLARHGVYSLSDAALRQPPETPVADSHRWPGLPLMIAAFMGQWPDHGAILRKMQWINLATGAATVLLVGFVAASAMPAWAAAAAALLTAVSPHLVSFGVYVLTESPATFLIVSILALCAIGAAAFGSQPLIEDRRPVWIWAAALGVAIGLTALFRPIFLLFPLFLALAFASLPHRRMLIVALLIGTAVPVAPWLIRNAIGVGMNSSVSPLGKVLVAGAYPGYVFNGDARTFPYPYEFDPRAEAAFASVPSALAEVRDRVAADPVGMTEWYLLGKPRYLWQFDNVDGAGGVLIYPVRQTPFDSNPALVTTHSAMRWLHWPIVALAALGAILVWLPRASRHLWGGGLMSLRAASLLLLFVTAAHFPFWVATRMAVPVFPALFLLAPVPIAVAIRAFRK